MRASVCFIFVAVGCTMADARITESGRCKLTVIAESICNSQATTNVSGARPKTWLRSVRRVRYTMLGGCTPTPSASRIWPQGIQAHKPWLRAQSSRVESSRRLRLLRLHHPPARAHTYLGLVDLAGRTRKAKSGS